MVGLFLSVDTQEGNAQGVNPYGYVRENPETMTDPTGERVAGCIPGHDGCNPDGTPTGCPGGQEMRGGACVPIPPTSNDCAATGQVLEGGQCVTPSPDLACNSRACFDKNGNLVGYRHIGRGKSGASFTPVPQPTPQQIEQGQKNARRIAGIAVGVFAWLAVALAALGLLIGGYAAFLMSDPLTFLLGAFLMGVGIGLGIVAAKAAYIATLFSQEENEDLSWFARNNLTGEEDQMVGSLGGLTTFSVASWVLSFTQALPKLGTPPMIAGGMGLLFTDVGGTMGLIGLVTYFTNQQQNAAFT